MSLSSEHLDRFWSRVTLRQFGCWEWIHEQRKGYGVFRVCGVKYAAHRLSFTLLKREIPANLVIDHLCRNTLCVNPDHMEPVQNKINILRGIGPTAVNARKVYCRNGHELSFENIWKGRNAKKQRRCAICIKDYYQANKEAIKARMRQYRRNRAIQGDAAPARSVK